MALIRERQQELELNYYFICECPRCLSPEPIVDMTGSACPNPNCDNCINISNTEAGDRCDKCGTVISAEFKTDFGDIMEKTQKHLDNMKVTTGILYKIMFIKISKKYLFLFILTK